MKIGRLRWFVQELLLRKVTTKKIIPRKVCRPESCRPKKFVDQKIGHPGKFVIRENFCLGNRQQQGKFGERSQKKLQ